MKSLYLLSPWTVRRDLEMIQSGVAAFIADTLFSRGGARTWPRAGKLEEAGEDKVCVAGST
jgi:hypothetical protein